MAWSWSHTAEAYNNARENVLALSKRELLVILREWAFHDREEAGKPGSFRLAFNGRKAPQDALADAVWDRAAELATCDNGGFKAWICPDGCHTVSFDKEEE